MKQKQAIPILLLCVLLFLTLPTAATEDTFPEIQFAAAGSGHTHLPATDLQTKNINELLGAKKPPGNRKTARSSDHPRKTKPTKQTKQIRDAQFRRVITPPFLCVIP